MLGSLQDDEQLRARASSAYHEAGHAVAAVLLGFQFKHVTIAPEEGSLGHVLYGIYTMFLNVGRRAYRRDLRDYLVCNRAGPLAEERHTGHRNDDGAADDDDEFRDILYPMYGERREQYDRDLTGQAGQLVTTHWRSIERVAYALIEDRTLPYATVEQIVQRG
jgi:hypothetical protein